jgi:hypothetical protein
MTTWTQGEDKPLNIYAKDGRSIAKVDGVHATGARTQDEAEENARLIVATPELLSALQNIVKANANYDDLTQTLLDAEAAIANPTPTPTP